jgi:hypothetical protein
MLGVLQVVPASGAKATTAADEPPQGKRDESQQPEDGGVEDRVAGNAGPEGAERQDARYSEESGDFSWRQ